MPRALLIQDRKVMEAQGDYLLIFAITSTDEKTICQICAGGEIPFPEFVATFGEAAARKVVNAGKKMGMSDGDIIRTARLFSEQIIKEAVNEVERRSHDRSKGL